MTKHRSFPVIIPIIIGVSALLLRPRKVRAPIKQEEPAYYPGTSVLIKPGDLLFSPIGKSDSKFIGHVGIVNQNNEVVHSIPAGLIKDPTLKYFQKFRSISIYSPLDDSVGEKASFYLEWLYQQHPKADYRIFTPLGGVNHEQYCTKIVWQSFYYGAGINLGNFQETSKAIHPELLKDRRYLKLKAKNL